MSTFPGSPALWAGSFTLHFDVPTVALNDALTDRQFEACSFARLFCREELGRGPDIEVEEHPLDDEHHEDNAEQNLRF